MEKERNKIETYSQDLCEIEFFIKDHMNKIFDKVESDALSMLHTLIKYKNSKKNKFDVYYGDLYAYYINTKEEYIPMEECEFSKIINKELGIDLTKESKAKKGFGICLENQNVDFLIYFQTLIEIKESNYKRIEIKIYQCSKEEEKDNFTLEQVLRKLNDEFEEEFKPIYKIGKTWLKGLDETSDGKNLESNRRIILDFYKISDFIRTLEPIYLSIEEQYGKMKEITNLNDIYI